MRGREGEVRILRVGTPRRGIKCVIFVWEAGRQTGSLPVPADLTTDQMVEAVKKALRLAEE